MKKQECCSLPVFCINKKWPSKTHLATVLNCFTHLAIDVKNLKSLCSYFHNPFLSLFFLNHDVYSAHELAYITTKFGRLLQTKAGRYSLQLSPLMSDHKNSAMAHTVTLQLRLFIINSSAVTQIRGLFSAAIEPFRVDLGPKRACATVSRSRVTIYFSPAKNLTFFLRPLKSRFLSLREALSVTGERGGLDANCVELIFS